MTFTGIQAAEEFRRVPRAHVIAWRRWPRCSIICARKTPSHITRSKASNARRTTAPKAGSRHWEILATLLYHALRREELCKLKVKDFKQERRGVPHLKEAGKGGKTRYVQLHPAAGGLIHDYLELAGHGTDEADALFRPLSNNTKPGGGKAIPLDGIYKLVRAYSSELGFTIGAHSLRPPAATNALDHQADIAKVQEWLGHANIATTRIYDHRKTRPEDSPTFKANY